MLVVIIIFVVAGAAALRAGFISDSAEKNNASRKTRNHLETVGAAYMLVFILSAFAIAGTIEAGL